MKNKLLLWISVLLLVILSGCSDEKYQYSIENADKFLINSINNSYWSWTVEKYLKQARKELISEYPLEWECYILDFKEKNENEGILSIRCSVWVRYPTIKNIEYIIQKQKNIQISTGDINSNDILTKDTIDKNIKIGDYVKYRDYIWKVILMDISGRTTVYIDWLEDYLPNWYRLKGINVSEIRKLNTDELKLYINN